MIAELPPRRPLPASYQPPPAHAYLPSRSTAANTFPSVVHPAPPAPLPLPPQQQPYPTKMQVHSYTSRRTPSNATYSTMSSSNGPLAFRQSQDLRRTASNRSGASQQPAGYVALMRKQKATVWCDRAQHEDARLAQANKAAKMRANLEVMGGNLRTSSGSSVSLSGGNRVTAKIRHHGKASLVGYTPGDLVGGVGGVPMRLSATEVEGGDSGDDADSGHMAYGKHHRRSGSGRSSLGSQRRGLTYSSRQSTAGSTVGRWSQGSSPPNEREGMQEAPVPAGHPRARDYFASAGSVDGEQSTGSASSGEKADAVTELGEVDAARLASNSLLKSTVAREKSMKNPDDLRRRGSVDERTMTLSAGRLFIANPDADSD